MRILFYILSLVFMQCVLFSCKNNNQQTTSIDKLYIQNTILANVIGSYSGNLPCVDCDAIQTILTLDTDYSYIMTYLYYGKSSEEFVKEGTWSIKNDVLELEGLDYKYKIEDEGLVQLDLSGNKILGDISERYQLLKVK